MWKKCGAILLLLMFTNSASSYGFGTSKFEKEVEAEASAVKLTREVIEGGYGLITTSELHKLIKSDEEILIIDTMPYAASYKEAHIPGAAQFLFPIEPMNEWNSAETDGKSKTDFTALLGDNKEKKIIIYCGFVKCTRSHNGALWAKNLGYQNVYRHPGGIFAWKGAGYDAAKVK